MGFGACYPEGAEPPFKKREKIIYKVGRGPF